MNRFYFLGCKSLKADDCAIKLGILQLGMVTANPESTCKSRRIANKGPVQSKAMVFPVVIQIWQS